MIFVLIFGFVLLVALLLSELSDRTVLSTAVLFLVAGFCFGGVLGWIHIRADNPSVSQLAELALVAVLNSSPPLQPEWKRAVGQRLYPGSSP